MAIPKFQEITLPMLKLASDGNVWSLGDAREDLAKHFPAPRDRAMAAIMASNWLMGWPADRRVAAIVSIS